MKQDPQSADWQENLSRAGSLREVDELHGVGVKKLRVFSNSQLHNLVRVALNRVLQNQIGDLQLSAPAVEAIRNRSLEEFERLVLSGLEKTDSPAPKTAVPKSTLDNSLGARPAKQTDSNHIEAAKEELLQFSSELKSRGLSNTASRSEQVESTSRLDPAGVDRVALLGQNPHSTGAGLGENSDPDAIPEVNTPEWNALEDKIVNNVNDLIDRDWRTELSQMRDSHQQQLSLMERRISKLMSALESTDQVIAHLQSSRASHQLTHGGEANAGNIGLTPENPLFEKKSQLLSALFQVNKEFRHLEKSHEDSNEGTPPDSDTEEIQLD